MKNTSSRKYVDLFCSVFNKTIPDATKPYFQNVGGESQPPYFIKGKIFSYGITLTTTKLFGFYLQGIQTILFAFVSIKKTQNVNS